MKLQFIKLKIITFYLLLAFVPTINANSANYQGQYQGNVSGQSATLTLKRSSNTVQGEINVGGYIYKVQGNIQGSNLVGIFSDPNTGGQGLLSASQQAKNIVLQLLLPGQYQPLTLNFEQTSETNSSISGPMAGTNSQTNSNTQQGGDNQPAFQRDPSVVGNWSKTDSYTSGEFSAATQFFLSISADGRYRYGDGRFAGGTGGVSGTAGGGDAEIGEWMTQNRIIYIRQHSQQQWQPYARYYVEGYSMMFTFGDGSKAIWKRY